MTARWRKVRTQSELEQVVDAGDFADIVGDGHFSVGGSATVRASGSATVRASGSATVRAAPYVAVHKKSGRAQIAGGVVIEPPDLTIPTNWLAYHGITPDADGIVILYKAVDDQWLSSYRTSYAPGTTPNAPDWQPTNACGAGLHFSPRPQAALAYSPGPKFVACPVLAADIVPIGSAYDADKCKAPRVVAPGCYEVTIDGQPVVAEQVPA